MKAIVCLFVTVFAIALAGPSGRGCIYISGKCSQECPEGTHSYSSGCGPNSFFTPEATCKNPNPVPDTRGALCDFSACYCDAPTVRDEMSNQCVSAGDCPKN